MTTAQLHSKLSALAWLAFRPAFRGSCSQWVEQNIRFHEPGREGKFSFYTREYLREPLDFYSSDDTDMVLCFGTQTGKTTTMFAGTAFRVWQKARRALYVKPTTKGTAGAEGDARTRFIPLLRASEILRGLIPTGARRHDFKCAQQILLNGSIVDWTGSNSVANLASNSFEDVSQDEIDKFNTTRRRDDEGDTIEANAVDLADERTGIYRQPKRVKSSTPTLTTGRVWSELLKSDLRRRFVPCPLCGRDHPSSKLVLIAWSNEYTTLPKKFGYATPYEPGTALPLAFIEWDKEARREDGTWDFQRVEKSAGYKCPHCGGRFQDESKTWMDSNGVWIPTQRGAPRSRGYQLPSMYSSHEENTAGKMALKFLKEVKSVEGPRNFINSKLAEAYSAQGVSANRVGLASRHIEVTGEWLKTIAVDYQQVSPYFWVVCRAWNGKDQTHGIEYRPMNDWSELDEFQEKHKVIPQAVIIDVGFRQAEVLQNCANIEKPSRCILGETVQDAPPECVGWNPAKSFGGKRMYRDEESGLFLPYRLKKDVDPYAGTELAHTMRIELLEWTSDIFEDMLELIRTGKTGLVWTISKEMDTDEYHKHLAGKVRKKDPNNPRSYKWDTAYRGVPDHLHVCETMGLVLAYRLQLISFSAIQTKEKEPSEK